MNSSYTLIVVILVTVIMIGATIVLSNLSKNDSSEPYEEANKRIWAYWHTELEYEPQKYIAQNVEYWRKTFEPLGWEIVIVTPSNLSTWHT